MKYHDNYKITKSLADVALKKLFIHQNSYLGLGEKTKKPLIQDECWNTNLIINRIKNIKNNSDKIFHKKCFNKTCFDILKQCSKNDFIYLDPPFYHNSETMFKYSFKTYEHLKLSNFVQNLECPWIMSYDDCIETRTLYKWAYYKKFDIEYYIYGKKYAKKELLISSSERMLDILTEHNIFV